MLAHAWPQRSPWRRLRRPDVADHLPRLRQRRTLGETLLRVRLELSAVIDGTLNTAHAVAQRGAGGGAAGSVPPRWPSRQLGGGGAAVFTVSDVR